MTDRPKREKKGAKLRRRPRPVQGVVDGLHLLMVLHRTHGDDHDLTVDAAMNLGEILGHAKLPLTLRFIGRSLFYDGAVLPMDRKGQWNAWEVGAALHALSVHELSFTAKPDATATRKLGAALAGGASGERDALEGVELEGITWRGLPGLEPDGKLLTVDLEVQVSDLVGRVVEDTEKLARRRADPWDLGQGLSVVRGLAQVRKVSSFAGLRALEVAVDDWTIPRRAVAGAFRALVGLTALGVNQAVTRAVVHSTLACCCHGLRERGGISLTKAADAALRAVLEGLSLAEGVAPPHHVRVCAVLHRLRTARTMSLLGPRVTGLVHLAYEMERRRCPATEGHELTFAELLAQAVESGANTYNEVWVKLIASAAGGIPVGTAVQLADGSVGIIMGPGDGDDPLRPRVQVGEQVVVARDPVELLSAASLRVGVD